MTRATIVFLFILTFSCGPIDSAERSTLSTASCPVVTATCGDWFDSAGLTRPVRLVDLSGLALDAAADERDWERALKRLDRDSIQEPPYR